MTSSTPRFSGVETLTYNDRKTDHPIRMVLDAATGVPRYALADIAKVLGVTELGARLTLRRTFPNFLCVPDHARVLAEDAPEGLGVLVTPVGVLWFTALTDPGRGQGICAWARREAFRLCPQPPEGDPAMFLTWDENAELPPKPYKYSGWLSAYRDLKDSNAYWSAREALRRQAHEREMAIMDKLYETRMAEQAAAQEASQ